MKRKNNDEILKKISSKKKPIYENCSVYTIDNNLLFRCNRKKINWYLSKDLAETIEPKANEDIAIRLKFVAKGKSHSDTLWGTEDRVNQCCVCGTFEHLNLHHVFPYVYRKWCPELIKSHTHHDILPLCTLCHSNYENHAQKLKTALVNMFDMPLENKGYIEYPDNRPIIKAANALKWHSEKIPEERKEHLFKTIKDFFDARKMSASMTKEEMIEQAMILPTLERSDKFLEHGEYVIKQILAITPPKKRHHHKTKSTNNNNGDKHNNKEYDEDDEFCRCSCSSNFNCPCNRKETESEATIVADDDISMKEGDSHISSKDEPSNPETTKPSNKTFLQQNLSLQHQKKQESDVDKNESNNDSNTESSNETSSENGSENSSENSSETSSENSSEMSSEVSSEVSSEISSEISSDGLVRSNKKWRRKKKKNRNDQKKIKKKLEVITKKDSNGEDIYEEAELKHFSPSKSKTDDPNGSSIERDLELLNNYVNKCCGKNCHCRCQRLPMPEQIIKAVYKPEGYELLPIPEEGLQPPKNGHHHRPPSPTKRQVSLIPEDVFRESNKKSNVISPTTLTESDPDLQDTLTVNLDEEEKNSQKNEMLERFIKMWRKHFLKYTQPKYLSVSWQVSNSVYCD